MIYETFIITPLFNIMAVRRILKYPSKIGLNVHYSVRLSYL